MAAAVAVLCCVLCCQLAPSIAPNSTFSFEKGEGVVFSRPLRALRAA